MPLDEALYEAEQVIVYLTHTRHGQRLLGYLSAETERGRCDLLAPISDETLLRLRDTRLGVREALTATRLWLRHQNYLTGEIRIWAVRVEEVPDQHLPLPNTPLYPPDLLDWLTRHTRVS